VSERGTAAEDPRDGASPLLPFRGFLLALQDRICAALEAEDASVRFRREEIERPGAGLSRPRVLEDGEHLERAAVNFSHTRGSRLPATATERRPELAGADYEAVSISLIVHPRNPYAPTTHANFRAFRAHRGTATEALWFGGGFDLTPYYGFEEDCVHWHEAARAACRPFGDGLYERLKDACDRYFFLPHRGEPRGIGGIFFDDFEEGGLAAAEAFTRSAAEWFLPAYLPILARRKGLPYGERERAFQLYRRGRYVEFNLLYDRGTRFGLQAGGRTESILASMPPLVRFAYDYVPQTGTPEARLTEHFLVPRAWAGTS
jgi:coproporphyrinogen III oxidase